MNQRQRIRRVQWAVGKVQKRLGKLSVSCLYPGCNKLAINSHSQQKEGQLRAIAKNGLVYGFKRNMVFHAKQIAAARWNPLTTIGIAEASTFLGYCAGHDHALFSPIETRPLIPGDPEQASLLFLRAMSFEYAAKREGTLQREMLANTIGGDADREWHEHNALFTEGMRLFLEREGPFYLGQIFEIISKKNYEHLHTAWVRVPQTLPFSVTTSVCPWLNDYEDKRSVDKPQAMVSFAVIPAGNHTDVVCSWLDYCCEDAKWIEEEMQTLHGTERIVNLLGLAESEDFCVGVDFWETLPESSKELILANMRHDFFRGPLATVPIIVELDKTEQAVPPDRLRSR